MGPRKTGNSYYYPKRSLKTCHTKLKKHEVGWGISSRMVSGRGRDIFFVFIHLRKQTLSVSSSWHTSGHVLVTGAVWWVLPPFSRGCLPQGREWAWTKKGQDIGAQPSVPTHPAPSPAALGAPRGLPRAAPLLFSRLQLRLRKCCPRPERRGCRLYLPPHPIKMTTDPEAKGRRGAVGQWRGNGDTHTRPVSGPLL